MLYGWSPRPIWYNSSPVINRWTVFLHHTQSELFQIFTQSNHSFGIYFDFHCLLWHRKQRWESRACHHHSFLGQWNHKMKSCHHCWFITTVIYWWQNLFREMFLKHLLYIKKSMNVNAVRLNWSQNQKVFEEKTPPPLHHSILAAGPCM